MTRLAPYFAECFGTAALLAVVIGSGIMGESLAAGNTAIALLANTMATACGLFVLIGSLGPVSGAQFNPVVTLMCWARKEQSAARSLGFIALQCAGGVLGVWLAHAMFDLSVLQTSAKVRASDGLWLSEFVATSALLWTIHLARAESVNVVAGRVACVIAAAYWFTASTSFANPAVTFARSLSDTFAGIRPVDVPMFLAMQFLALIVFMLVTGLGKPKRLLNQSIP